MLSIVMTSRLARRAATATVAAVGLTLLMASPALADVPEGWSDPSKPSAWAWIFILVVAPIALTAIITLLVAGPGILKGHGLTGGQPEPVPGMSSETHDAH
jgi:hypothetical protein